MKGYTSGKNKHHVLVQVIIYTILVFIIFIAVGMPIFQSQYIYPGFLKQIVENTENQAIRTGQHLTRNVLGDYSDGQLALSEEMKIGISYTGKDYNLWKIKIFSKSGVTIYSTSEEDIGVINKRSYFHDIVAEGEIYTKLVKKNTKSLEGQVVTSDVVETYIPIMSKGSFVGAFELYYNITASKESMDNLVYRYNVILHT